ncbi:hypothetical protein B4U79_17422 [Dinothrombium tinctorium]|uniref:RHD domain-containing protein n=1 Tax=Dinothrombium tinctorium TaxID=1965070 RepID=A0A3S3NUF3_9ACAR|nr:hypothetical protein B4U79_17696 [Dinothrombium tinctorium]RWS12746.1 hypothetical protein B4U79_17422 [Dinothrombium tinctorium]
MNSNNLAFFLLSNSIPLADRTFNQLNASQCDNFMETIESLNTLSLSRFESEEISDQIELKIIKQPSNYHRARYLTEGVRRPLADANGTSFPTVKLVGFDKAPVKALCYISDANTIEKPHPLFRICAVHSKYGNNATEVQFGDSTAIEFSFRPENGMEAVLNCIGIVKQRMFEIKLKERKSNKHSDKEKAKQSQRDGKPGCCRLVFQCKHPKKNGILRAVSDTILCKQITKAPEIHRISINQSSVRGGDELFIFGKNFSSEAKVVFSVGKQWRKAVKPQKEFVHKTHLVCNIPAFDTDYADLDAQAKIEAQLCVFSSGKSSNSQHFTYYM